MITLLRKIRRKLISKSRLTQYLLYAIGEIALVMIGILLALQVNNWNESRKQNNSEHAILKDLHEEFTQNKSTFQPHLNRKIEVKEMLETLIETIADPSSDSPLKDQERGPCGCATYNASLSTIQSVIETGSINIISNDSLRYLLNNWSDLLIDFTEDEEWHIHFLHNVLYKYETQHSLNHYFKTLPRDGFISPFHNTEEMKNLFNTAYEDPEYQNLLLRNHQYLNGTVDEGYRILEMMGKVIDLLKDEIVEKEK